MNGEWHSAVASRHNDDGTTSMVTIDPGVVGFEFVMEDRDGKRALIVRDMQHQYVFLEAPSRAVGLSTTGVHPTSKPARQKEVSRVASERAAP